MDDAAKRAKEVVPGMDIRLPGGRRLDDAIAAAIREAVDAEREQFPAELAANWEACGPWVPDADLVERGQAIKAQFVKMLADRRIREGTRAMPAPTWTKEPPTQPGHYWYRDDPGDAPEVLYLVRSPSGIGYANGNPLNDYRGEWWPVPVQEPPA